MGTGAAKRPELESDGNPRTCMGFPVDMHIARSYPQAMAGRIRSAEMLTAASRPDQFPEAGAPEIAFLGRSNVGKSSLINVLCGRKRVGVAAMPGKTKHF